MWRWCLLFACDELFRKKQSNKVQWLLLQCAVLKCSKFYIICLILYLYVLDTSVFAKTVCFYFISVIVGLLFKGSEIFQSRNWIIVHLFCIYSFLSWFYQFKAAQIVLYIATAMKLCGISIEKKEFILGEVIIVHQTSCSPPFPLCSPFVKIIDNNALPLKRLCAK